MTTQPPDVLHTCTHTLERFRSLGSWQRVHDSFSPLSSEKLYASSTWSGFLFRMSSQCSSPQREADIATILASQMIRERGN